MSKKSHHFLTLWPWPLTYDLEKLIRSGHYHYQCVYQIWEQSIPWFLSYRVNTIAGGGRLRRKTITSPDPSDTGDIIISFQWWGSETRHCLTILGLHQCRWWLCAVRDQVISRAIVDPVEYRPFIILMRPLDILNMYRYLWHVHICMHSYVCTCAHAKLVYGLRL